MRNNLVQLDSAFTEHYQQLLNIQKDLFDQYKTYDFDLNKIEITEAVYKRMMSFWYFNVWNTHDVLGRNMTPSGADFFTETCMLFFKAYFEVRYDCVVKSEKSIVKSKNSLRPDITIWSKDEIQLLAVVELKVNDGWKRKTMDEHLRDREEKIRAHFPNAYFGVISFWNFFDITNENWKNKFVGLYEFRKEGNHPKTDGCIEDIMKQIEKHIL